MSESENKETGKLGFGLRIRKMLLIYTIMI